MQELARLQNALIAADHRGFAFLLVNGLAWLGLGLLARRLAPQRVALLLLLQSFWTVPASLGVERLLGFSSVAADNPLGQLALLLPFIAVPAVLFTLRAKPIRVPAVFSAVVGGHFLPYAWVYRTPVYAVLAGATAVLPFLLALYGEEKRLVYGPLLVGACLVVGAALVF